MKKTLQFIFGLAFTLTGGIATLVKLMIAIPDHGGVGNYSVLWAYGFILILFGGVLLLQSAFEKEE